MSTLQLRLPLRRRLLRRVVFAAVSGCALILVAAGVTRVVHASSEPDRVARASASPVPSSANRAVATSPQGTTTGASNEQAPVAVPSTSTAGAASSGTGTAQPAPMAGTLHLERNVTPRFVLLDGKKLSSRTEVVACGSHTIKVGHGKAHPIDIPCGGDLTVSR